MTTIPASTLDAGAESRTARPTVWRSGLVAAAAGAAVTGAYGAMLSGIGVPMVAGGFGATSAQPIVPANFSFGTVLCTAVATLLAAVLARRALHPTRTFIVVTVTLTLLSLVSPIAAGATAPSTKVGLAVGHLLAAVVVIPVLARRLRQIEAAGPDVG